GEHARLHDLQAPLLQLVLVRGAGRIEGRDDLAAANAAVLVDVVDHRRVPALLVGGRGDAEDAVGGRPDDVGERDRDLDLAVGHAGYTADGRRAPGCDRAARGGGVPIGR